MSNFNEGDKVVLARPRFTSNKGVEGTVTKVNHETGVIRVTHRPTTVDRYNFVIGETAVVDLSRLDLVESAVPAPYTEIKHSEVRVGDEILAYPTYPIPVGASAHPRQGVVDSIKYRSEFYTANDAYLGNDHFERFLLISRNPVLKASDLKEGSVVRRSVATYVKTGVSTWTRIDGDLVETRTDEQMHEVLNNSETTVVKEVK